MHLQNTKTVMSRKIRILSIDGGGIRGIIPAVILNYIEKNLQSRLKNDNVTLADFFDLIAGTSTGGILACYYLLPPLPGTTRHSRYFAHEAVDMYVNHGKDIFDQRFLRHGVTKEKYPVAGLEMVLKENMGDTTLAQTRKDCLITAYDITERKAVLFTSFDARKHEHKNFLMRDVARATSAAPTYFELASIKSLGGAASHLIDGAMFAGNPTLCAVVESNKSTFGKINNPTIDELYVVSVGTGKENKKYDSKKAAKWGTIGWVRPIVDILLSASAEVVDYQLKQLFLVAECQNCYVRLEPGIGKAKTEMDNASKENIRQLKDAGESFIQNNLKKLDEITYQLIMNNEQ